MEGLLEADEVEVLVLVDNVSDNLSSAPDLVETETARLARRGVDLIAGHALCTAAHGLALLVTVRRGGEERTLLFDAGPDGEVLARNAQRLGADLGAVDAVVLSHGHWDHAGGLLRGLDLVRAAGGAAPVPCLLHPDMFHQRAAERRNGTLRLLEDVPSPRQLAARGAAPDVTTDPRLVLDGLAWVSGEIPRVTPFERGLPGQRRRADEQAAWEPDELVADERFLAVRVRGRGLVVLSACSHAGVVNVASHAAALTDGPLCAVVGGLHLAGDNERVIPETVEALATFAPAILAPGHCTGWRATAALLEAFGDERLAPLSVGKRLTL